LSAHPARYPEAAVADALAAASDCSSTARRSAFGSGYLCGTQSMRSGAQDARRQAFMR
jgi:hypothetical protein